MAITPDGRRLFVALDDQEEIAEASIDTLKVLRRRKVPGMPYGLAIDPAGERLFVACKQDDTVRVLDLSSLEETGSIPVGAGPVALAFCRCPEGDRLIVANSMSDDISIVAVSPLKEVCRLSAGREPFAVAASLEGMSALVANRLTGLASVKSAPESEITVVNPSTARLARHIGLMSAHLSEGICLVTNRSWALSPLVRSETWCRLLK